MIFRDKNIFLKLQQKFSYLIIFILDFHTAATAATKNCQSKNKY